MREGRARGLLLLLAGAAVFAMLYGPAMGVPFWHDDFIWIARALAPHGLDDLFAVRHFNFARPTTVLWYHLLAPLCGTDPIPWRMASSALLLSTAIALAALTRDDDGSNSSAFAAALFFVAAAHHWELVYSAAAVGDPLAGLFTLLALLAMNRDRSAPATRWKVGSLIAITLAAGAKESACVAPLLVMAHEVLCGGPLREAPRRARRAIAPVAVTAVVLGLDVWLVSQTGRPVPHPALSADMLGAWGAQIAASLLTVPLRDTLLPHTDVVGRAALATWSLLLLGSLAWERSEAQRRVTFALTWIGLSWTPYVVLANGHLDQDRYGYLPSIGTALLLGALIDRWRTGCERLTGWRRPVAAGTGYVCVLALLTWNAHCLIVSRESLRHWLGQRGSVADRVREVARRCPADAPVYVFNDPRMWHEGGYAFALYGGHPLTQVHDGFDFLEDRPGLHRGLLWDHEAARFTDLGTLPAARGDEIDAPPNELLPLRRWRRDDLLESSVGRFSTSGTGWLTLETRDPSAWRYYRIWVRYRVHSAVDNPRMGLGWSSQKEGPFSPECAMWATLVCDGEMHEAVFFPWMRESYWKGGSVQRLRLCPADQPAEVEITEIHADAPSRRPQRVRVE